MGTKISALPPSPSTIADTDIFPGDPAAAAPTSKFTAAKFKSYIIGGPFVEIGTASANFVEIDGANTGNPPGISASGSDTDVSLRFNSQGAGKIVMNAAATQLGDQFVTNGVLNFVHNVSAFTTGFQSGNATASVTYTLPTAGPASNGYSLTSTTGGVLSWSNISGGGGGTPGGSTTQVQYNNAGAFGGITGATTNGTALTLVAPVLGTPASVTLTNGTGLPIATGVSGLGTGVATALAVNTGAAGAPVLFNGAGGTPSSLTLTNATGLPVAGITASTSTALGVGSIELGNASDTTLARVSAGLISVEGVNVETTATTANSKITALGITIDGGGAALTTGIKADIEVPFACTINRVTMLADVSGSVVVDIWKDTYTNYPPTVADTITASAKPTITTATKSQDSTLTGWTTSIAAGDTIRFNVDSATTITRVTLSLKVTKT